MVVDVIQDLGEVIFFGPFPGLIPLIEGDRKIVRDMVGKKELTEQIQTAVAITGSANNHATLFFFIKS